MERSHSPMCGMFVPPVDLMVLMSITTTTDSGTTFTMDKEFGPTADQEPEPLTLRQSHCSQQSQSLWPHPSGKQLLPSSLTRCVSWFIHHANGSSRGAVWWSEWSPSFSSIEDISSPVWSEWFSDEFQCPSPSSSTVSAQLQVFFVTAGYTELWVFFLASTVYTQPQVFFVTAGSD